MSDWKDKFIRRSDGGVSEQRMDAAKNLMEFIRRSDGGVSEQRGRELGAEAQFIKCLDVNNNRRTLLTSVSSVRRFNF